MNPASELNDLVENVRDGIARRKVERTYLITVNFHLNQTIAHNKERVARLEREMLALSGLPAKAAADLALNNDDGGGACG